MVNVGLAQMMPKIGNLEHNRDELERMLRTASESNIDVLVIPELANSGYAFNSLEEARSLAEDVPHGTFCRILADWTNSGRLAVAGICENSADGLYNSGVVFGDGRHMVTYRKVHLFGKEKEWFVAGSKEPPVVEFHGHRYGVMVCFDWAFPEMSRILALKGAQIILHPANLVLPFAQNAMITRSIENRVFTATANRVGEERGLGFSGMSQVTSPKGDVLLRMTTERSSLACCDVDMTLADNKMITQQNDVLRDRRPDIYKRLTKPT